MVGEPVPSGREDSFPVNLRTSVRRIPVGCLMTFLDVVGTQNRAEFRPQGGNSPKGESLKEIFKQVCCARQTRRHVRDGRGEFQTSDATCVRTTDMLGEPNGSESDGHAEGHSTATS